MFEQRKARNYRFSLRSWARELGLSHATPLSQILNSKRSLPDSYLPKLAKNLGLTSPQTKYFQAIAKARFSKSSVDREVWSKRALQLLKRARLKFYYVDALEIFENPLHMTILQLTDFKDFCKDPDWIQKQLYFDVSIEEIKKSYSLLLSQGFLAETPEGEVTRVHRHVSSAQDIESMYIRKFHEVSLKQAASAVYTQEMDEREFASHILAIQKKDLIEAKRMIRDFTRTFIARFSESTAPSDALYHLNLNLFSQTKPSKISKAG